MRKLLLPFVLTMICAVGLNAAEIGDPAASLDIQEWVKGKPVSLADGKGKTIYVVEFWATWCGPCRVSIPHMTEMQKQFKDKGVVFIGVSDEKPDVVKKFVQKMGEKMDYRVAIDAGKTSEGYMEAFDQNGIPTAFIVDKEGRIAWYGHPMGGLEKTLEEIIGGKYDIEAAKAKAKKQAEAASHQREIQTKLQQLAQQILTDENSDETKKLEQEVIALDKKFGGIMGGEKFDPANFRKRVHFSQKVRSYQQALLNGENTNEIATLEKALETGAPDDFDLKKFKQMMAQQVELHKAGPTLQAYLEAVCGNTNSAEISELTKKVEALELKNPELLHQFAWAILTEDAIKVRDTKLALKFAKRAVDNSDGKDVSIVDTYARALFDNGKIDEAITQQKKAIELTEDDAQKAELQKSLDTYEAKVKAEESK